MWRLISASLHFLSAFHQLAISNAFVKRRAVRNRRAAGVGRGLWKLSDPASQCRKSFPDVQMKPPVFQFEPSLLQSPVSLSLSSEERCSSPFISFVTVPCTLSCLCLFRMGSPAPRTPGPSAPGMTSPVWRSYLLAPPPNAASDPVSLPCSKVTLLAHVRFGVHQEA